MVERRGRAGDAGVAGAPGRGAAYRTIATNSS
jgi:hypothetical protein